MTMTDDQIKDLELEISDYCWSNKRTHEELWKNFSRKASLVDMNRALNNAINHGKVQRVGPGEYLADHAVPLGEVQTFILHEHEVNNNQEAKRDAGKPELSYLLEFPNALAGMTRVSEYGARKYGRNTWRRVEKQRYIDALLRHTFAIGTNALGKDKESSLFHIWQVMWNAAAIAELIEEEMQCTSN